MCPPSARGRGISLPVQLFPAQCAEATQGHGDSPGHKDSSVWGRVGLFRSGELSDAKFVAPGCGVCDSVLWPFWSRVGGVCQSPWTRTVGQTSTVGTATGFPFPSCPSFLMPASSSSVLPLLSSLFLLSALLCSLLLPPPLSSLLFPSKGTSALHQETDFFRPSGSAFCLLLISTVHPLQHAAVMGMF